MRLRTFDVAALILNLVHFAYTEHILSCNVTSIDPCPGDNQQCNQVTGRCECVKGFTMTDEDCKPESASPPSHATAAALVTLFTLALIAGGLVLVIRKYNLVDYVRQKINQRRNNHVMYEDVMIGQDDPPLSP
ncbi:uncharacterized protein LOC106139975 [Amyelois transitella]|uniref:uncharacterized protein LOC106139975 n=1 Tax=Amyelois transitella TaxID=680683 RepID=UPI00067DC3BC|nr:uncharacterized protein LOC106139975 [Amyelois transitella]